MTHYLLAILLLTPFCAGAMDTSTAEVNSDKNPTSFRFSYNKETTTDQGSSHTKFDLEVNLPTWDQVRDMSIGLLLNGIAFKGKDIAKAFDVPSKYNLVLPFARGFLATAGTICVEKAIGNQKITWLDFLNQKKAGHATHLLLGTLLVGVYYGYFGI